eukprot:6191776-Pleurochrysis_carterae.AAC.2
MPLVLRNALFVRFCVSLRESTGVCYHRKPLELKIDPNAVSTAQCRMKKLSTSGAVALTEGNTITNTFSNSGCGSAACELAQLRAQSAEPQWSVARAGAWLMISDARR